MPGHPWASPELILSSPMRNECAFLSSNLTRTCAFLLLLLCVALWWLLVSLCGVWRAVVNWKDGDLQLFGSQ